jgi:hypothetical protein
MNRFTAAVKGRLQGHPHLQQVRSLHLAAVVLL